VKDSAACRGLPMKGRRIRRMDLETRRETPQIAAGIRLAGPMIERRRRRRKLQRNQERPKTCRRPELHQPGALSPEGQGPTVWGHGRTSGAEGTRRSGRQGWLAGSRGRFARTRETGSASRGPENRLADNTSKTGHRSASLRGRRANRNRASVRAAVAASPLAFSARHATRGVVCQPSRSVQRGGGWTK